MKFLDNNLNIAYFCNNQTPTIMKRLLPIFLISLLFSSCNKKDDPTGFKVDVYATVNIKPAVGFRSAGEHISALEIVKKATVIHFTTSDLQSATRGFDKAQRDTISATPCLKMWGTDIINEQGVYEPIFIEGSNFVLEVWNGFPTIPYRQCKIDTIAYIPNSVIQSARISIKAAYNAGNSDEVYRLFNDAFTFVPITGSEYRELMKKGLN